MLYSDIVNAVYVETGRPDLVKKTAQTILSTTLALHMRENFARDIREAQVAFPYYASIQKLSIDALPRFRQLSYVRWDDGNFTSEGTVDPLVAQQNLLPPLYRIGGAFYTRPEIKVLQDPKEIIDPYFKTQLNCVAYKAGNDINIRVYQGLQYALVGFYQQPNVDTLSGATNFNSWIADKYPLAIIYDAAWQILSTTGKTDEATRYISNDPEKPGVATMWWRIIEQNEIVAAL